MRTPGSEVVRGRWGRSAAYGSLSEPLAVDDVAVFECCTPVPGRAGGLAQGRRTRYPDYSCRICTPMFRITKRRFGELAWSGQYGVHQRVGYHQRRTLLVN